MHNMYCIANNSFCFFIQTLKLQFFYHKNTDYYEKMSPNPQGVGLHLKVLRSSCISLIALLVTSTTLRPKPPRGIVDVVIRVMED